MPLNSPQNTTLRPFMAIPVQRKPGFPLLHKHQLGLLPTTLSKPSMTSYRKNNSWG